MASIPYTKPSITELEINLVDDAIRNGWGENCYNYLNRFEADFSNYLGVRHAIATSSATGALWLGFAGLGIGAGDEVIVADINWIATVSPLVHLGAKPVFVDIDPVSWCISPMKVLEAITARTRAIVVTHLYGNLANMKDLLKIGSDFGIPIIEDAAEAIGSKYQGLRAGSMGTFGVFSFHGTKTLTTGEGGMFVTNDTELFSKVLTLSNHGRSKSESRQFWPSEPGFKFKMSNVQAALGCGQLERIDELVERKREIFFNYRRLLADQEKIIMNPEGEGDYNSFWMPTIVFDASLSVSREVLLKNFGLAEIDARVFFWPLSSLDFFDDRNENDVSWSLPSRAINLPSFFDITFDQQKSVAKIIIETIQDCVLT